MSWSPFPPEGRARSPTRGENRARPPALLRKPTTNVRLSPSSYRSRPLDGPTYLPLTIGSPNCVTHTVLRSQKPRRLGVWSRALMVHYFLRYGGMHFGPSS